ncbi:MAG TPA: hypothetical protein VMQ93_10075 [Novosphingobium sp.]|nr:hypothetical protein [Novosphingobium sp.]
MADDLERLRHRERELIEALTAANMSAAAYRRWASRGDASGADAVEALEFLRSSIARMQPVVERMIADATSPAEDAWTGAIVPLRREG